jgi:hypothetical protein
MSLCPHKPNINNEILQDAIRTDKIFSCPHESGKNNSSRSYEEEGDAITLL